MYTSSISLVLRDSRVLILAETSSGLETSFAEGDSNELLWDSFLEAQPKTCSLGLLWIFTAPGLGVVLHNSDFYGNSEFISVDLPCQKYKNKAMHSTS